MARLDFNSLPVNTLVGASWSTFKRVVKENEIGKKYRGKYHITKFICWILSAMKPINDRVYKKRLASIKAEEEPLFILGHWRSGTTFVHNVLTKDSRFGYTTTYQTVFPHITLWGQKMFKGTMGAIMPDKRPTDNMELGVDLPQEEEFALSNMTPCNYYNFWFFPQRMLEYGAKYLTFKSATKEEVQEFQQELTKVVNISLANSGGVQYLSKNPPHTARVKEILEVYPNAKFIYLMRNPYTVFESTLSFFNNTIKPLTLQDFDKDKFESDILEVYKELYHKYEADKVLIPEGNLIELKFEDFEKDALAATKKIYETLSLKGFKEARPAIENYLEGKKGYKKNKYKYSDNVINKVESNWKFAIDQWGYNIEEV